MSSGGWMMLILIVVVVLTLGLLFFSMLRSIRDNRTEGRSVWREFGLGLTLMILFFVAWAGQAIAQWQKFTDDELAHGQKPEIGDFLSEFGMSTLENWQSEFLQLFSFVVLAALYIHKGSAESKDSEENIEASLRRLEEKLGTLPPTAPREEGERWKLPETPLEVADEMQRKEAAQAR